MIIDIKLFRGSFGPSDDGFANDAWYRLVNAGCAHNSDAESSWDEMSDVEDGEEFVLIQTDRDGIELLRGDGFRVVPLAVPLVAPWSGSDRWHITPII